MKILINLLWGLAGALLGFGALILWHWWRHRQAMVMLDRTLKSTLDILRQRRRG